MRRPTPLLLFAAIFAAELGWAGISPLLPTYQERYGLSDVATGLILTLASVGILLGCLCAAGLSSRFPVRTLTLWAMGALAMGNLLVGVSGSFRLLLLGRMLFGIGLGTMWVTGTACSTTPLAHTPPELSPSPHRSRERRTSSDRASSAGSRTTWQSARRS